MFRLVKEYKDRGYLKIEINDLREGLDIGKSYGMSEIDKYVFKGIIKELGFLFKNVNINKIKGKKGGKIEWLEFCFEGEKGIDWKGECNMISRGKGKEYISGEITPQSLKNNTYQPTTSNTSPYTQQQPQPFLQKIKK